MRKTLAALSALLVFSTAGFSVFAEGESGAGALTPETDQVIVKMKDGSGDSLENSEVVSDGSAGSDNIVTVEVPASESVDEFIEDLEKRNDVESVEPDHLVRLTYTPNDPDVAAKQYHHQNIETKKAWEKTKGSSTVVVAVIDDGADLSHPDLKKQIVSPFDTVKETGNTLPAGEHGTHVAGIIGSSIDNNIGGAGVAPHTKIMPVNVFDGDLAYTSDIIQAIHYAVEKGADIINLSLGSYAYSSAFNDAIQFAHKNGLVIVAAAGNEAVSTLYYPAAYRNVISVGSTTSNEVRSPFSNFGGYIDIAAPGSFIYSTLPHDSYGTMSGTSMASPVVAGTAALVMAAEPTLTNLEIENRLYSTADDLGSAGKDVYYGNGRVNARKALKIEFLPAPYVLAVYDYSASVSGTTEANAAIAIKVGTKAIASGTANQEGKFAVAIPKQPAGTKLSVTSTNTAGAVSYAAEIIVKDGTKPAAPAVNAVFDSATTIIGKAEANAKVHAYVGSKKLGEAVAANGVFKINIAKQQAGTSITVHAVDAAGNKSAGSTVKVIDKTAPPLPVVNAVGDNATAITGKAETNAKVYASNGSLKLGEAVAKNGVFTIKITKQKAGSTIAVYAVDASGNKSAGKSVKVADKTAPAAPSVNAVSASSTQITGKAEAKARVYAYVGKKKIGGAAASNGAYTIKIVKQKAGTSIAVYAVDSAGNKGPSKIAKVGGKTTKATIPSKVTGKYQVSANLHMRSGASVKYKSIAVIPKGRTVEYITKSGSWYKVKYGSKTGWVSSYYLRKPIAAVAEQLSAGSHNAVNPHTKALSLNRKSLKQSYASKNTVMTYSGARASYAGLFKFEFLFGSLPDAVSASDKI